MSEYGEGDRVRHERHGLGTVEPRAATTTGYATTRPRRVRVRWDHGKHGTTTVLAANLSPTPHRQLEHGEGDTDRDVIGRFRTADGYETTHRYRSVPDALRDLSQRATELGDVVAVSVDT